MARIDYKLIVSSLNKQIRLDMNNLVIREQQSVREQLPYPFATYSMVNPYTNVVNYRQDKENLTQSVEMILSYTFYSTDSFEAFGMAQQALTNLELYSTRQQLWDNQIAIVGVTGVSNRDTFISIEMERRCGFDIRLRINKNSEKVIRDIIEVELEDGSIINK